MCRSVSAEGTRKTAAPQALLAFVSLCHFRTENNGKNRHCRGVRPSLPSKPRPAQLESDTKRHSRHSIDIAGLFLFCFRHRATQADTSGTNQPLEVRSSLMVYHQLNFGVHDASAFAGLACEQWNARQLISGDEFRRLYVGRCRPASFRPRTPVAAD
jgi:hypothetical protein